MTSVIRYTREVLMVAAAQCKDIDEVILRFDDRSPDPRLRQYLMRRFSAYGIDVSHFKLRPYTRHEMPDEDSLRDAVTASTSLAETLRHLDRPDSFGWRQSLKTWIREAGLDTSHFLGQAHQRGKPGTVPALAAEDVLVHHEGKRRTTTKILRRALREIGVPDCCDSCGTPPEWHGRPMTLEIDHINGDWSDDRRQNLRLLCPNCHAITSTWCRGGARRQQG
ncbi:HNH endonuclease [Streptomyces spiramyceticus]|uniref:HNH endonuclease signature motif containing protein n=1 Tax=Streptomyces spiramyceticus TaxID=299717 RepID=UPI00237B892E|nr:HNH endonuclease [Streptomyces spiramyceticus]